MLSRVLSRFTPRVAPRIFASQYTRSFAASAVATRLGSTLDAEIKHEQEGYKAPPIISKFLGNNVWKYEKTGGDVNMTLTKKVGDKQVVCQWQLISPYDSAMDEEVRDGEGEADMDAPTDFSISVENEQGAGLTFYCQTQKGDNLRFLIGNVKAYGSSAERDSTTAYNGPDFEDLDDKVQESFDEYLGEMGVNDELCDFIDATAADKEQEEYILWLQTAKKFVSI